MVLKPNRQRIRSTECYDQKRRERKNDKKNAKVKMDDNGQWAVTNVTENRSVSKF